MSVKSSSPLAVDGWVEFNRAKWGVKTERLEFGETHSGPAAELVVYSRGSDRLFLPRLNPYVAMDFRPTATNQLAKKERQWLELGRSIAEVFKQRGLDTLIPLPPTITDARPWAWLGFKVGVRYTYLIEFPFAQEQVDHSVRKQIGKATKAGYICTRTANVADVVKCLLETETRQGFRHSLAQEDIKLAQEILGNDAFRTYVCYAPNGEPASARIVLHQSGYRTIDWVAGTSTAHLTTGATQLLIQFILDDLQQADAVGFDFAGANLPTIAAAKANWGGHLTPFLTVQPYGFKQLLHELRSSWKFAVGKV